MTIKEILEKKIKKEQEQKQGKRRDNFFDNHPGGIKLGDYGIQMNE